MATLLSVRMSGAEGFTRVDPIAAGMSFTNRIAPERYLGHQIPLNGSGLALGDVDGDGKPDVLFGGLGGTAELFRNLGDWHFSSMTTDAGLDWAGADVTGVALVDLDGDGFLDVVANSIGRGTLLWSNDGRGHFTRRAVLNPGRAGMSLAIADLDGDGDLDLYLTNYRGVTVRDEPGGRFSIKDDGQGPRVAQYNGRPTTEEDLQGRFTMGARGVRENGEPDRLYLNQGDWKFREVAWTDGTFRDEDGQPLNGPFYDWGLSVMARDFTGDGLPDLYVCNDFESPDRFWINRTVPGGPLRLQAVPILALRHTSAFSMGIDAADVDRDGHTDFLVLDMLSREHRMRNLQVAGLPPSMAMVGIFDDRPQFSHNTLFRARGDGTFAEVGRLAGVSASEWSWTPVFLDVDLDGYEDLLISNGHEMDMMDVDVSDEAERLKAQKRLSPREQLELRRKFRRLNTPNVAFRNRGQLQFEDVSHRWNFDAEEVGIGMAASDLDGDGDADLVVNNLNAAPTLYRNEATAARLPVRLRGTGANTRGIGARIRVSGGPVVQTQEMIAGGRYLSSDDPMRVFAAGTAQKLEVEVTWRSGARTTVADAIPGRVLEVREADARPTPAPPAPAAPWFVDASDRVGFGHGENAFDDAARQPLIPRNGSQAGPGITWTDLDGNGTDDLVVGAGQGALLGVFKGDGKGGFQRWFEAPFNRPAGRDLSTILPFPPALLAGSSNYEDGLTNGGAIRIFDLARKVSGEAVLNQGITAGPLAAADADGDGTMEVFIGGRAVPGEYPRASDSLMVRSVGGRLSPIQRFNQLGIVNDALFADLDGDGRAELVLACEWGPIRVLSLQEGRWTERTTTLGLAEQTGWWNSVATGDFDGDGRVDLLAGNWGRNVFFGSTPNQFPLRCHFGDFDGAGGSDLVESYVGPDGTELPVRKYPSVSQAMPAIKDRFPTHGAYGTATLAALYGEVLRTNPVVSVRDLSSRVFLNRGTRFESRPLPMEAQVSPVFGIAVADFDGDGIDDAFLGQNFFPVHSEVARQDAGVGVLLRGDGTGGFAALPPTASGLAVYGEARGAAVADFDSDGRTDLAVAQNGSALRLFRNQGARPGLRVSLDGGPSNPSGAGAQVRLWAGDKPGPVRVLHLGVGYWSCPSPVVIPGCPGIPTQVEVRWPGGRTTRAELPAEARWVRIKSDGKPMEIR